MPVHHRAMRGNPPIFPVMTSIPAVIATLLIPKVITRSSRDGLTMADTAIGMMRGTEMRTFPPSPKEGIR